MKKEFLFFAFAALSLFAISCGGDDDDNGGSGGGSTNTGKDYTQTENFELVDMGTRVKWATMNLGAGASYEYGELYQWSNITVTIGQAGTQYAFCRPPSHDEWVELINICGQQGGFAKWGSVKNISGLLLKSSKTGNIIFLPAAGRQDPYGVYDNGKKGYYWASSSYNSEQAYNLKFQQGAIAPGDISSIILGQSVRVVSDK